MRFFNYFCRCTEYPYRACLPDTWEEILAKEKLPGLEIREVAEGRGVFATQDFTKGQLVCNYGGILLDEDYVKNQLIDDDEKNKYLVEMTEKKCDDWVTLYLNHDETTSSMGKFINHSRIHANITYRVYVRKNLDLDVVFFAKCAISEGTELLWNYGNKFGGVNDCVQSCVKCKKK